ncbi:hypothetical protein PWT90_00734 [Aphanocladium album]|nr:hypothetical protein PWT90_00734 [Aphanocladium album]
MAGPEDPSLLLALQLMQQDLEELRSEQKGKAREGDPDDMALALEMQALNLANQIRSISDAAFCRRNFPQVAATQPAAAARVSSRPVFSEPAVAGPSRQTRTPPPAVERGPQPRCCKKPIMLESVRKFLTAELIAEVEKKQLEFNVTDRTYCSNAECSAFILPKDIVVDRGHCQACETSTCTICKRVTHSGMCPDDPHKAEILAIAKEQGWQQCYACNHLVELNTGCNHMRCRCKSEFCYACGEKWKTCKCELWTEARLVQRAEQLVNRGMFGGHKCRRSETGPTSCSSKPRMQSSGLGVSRWSSAM